MQAVPAEQLPPWQPITAHLAQSAAHRLQAAADLAPHRLAAALVRMALAAAPCPRAQVPSIRPVAL